jgi:hypothetical protein
MERARHSSFVIRHSVLSECHQNWPSIEQNTVSGLTLSIVIIWPVSNDTETIQRKRPEYTKRQAFIVQCVNYRCMAYRDSAGKWRDYFKDDEIVGEVTIISAA